MLGFETNHLAHFVLPLGWINERIPEAFKSRVIFENHRAPAMVFIFSSQ
jgi:hypothetical protein